MSDKPRGIVVPKARKQSKKMTKIMKQAEEAKAYSHFLGRFVASSPCYSAPEVYQVVHIYLTAGGKAMCHLRSIPFTTTVYDMLGGCGYVSKKWLREHSAYDADDYDAKGFIVPGLDDENDDHDPVQGTSQDGSKDEKKELVVKQPPLYIQKSPKDELHGFLGGIDMNLLDIEPTSMIGLITERIKQDKTTPGTTSGFRPCRPDGTPIESPVAAQVKTVEAQSAKAAAAANDSAYCASWCMY